MPGPPPPSATALPPPTFLTTALSLQQTFLSFLTVAIHSLLFHRALYPSTSFLQTRAYNLPIHQSRHPDVCRWVSAAVRAVGTQLASNSVARVIFVVLSERAAVLERWVFDLERFPVVPKGDALVEFAEVENGARGAAVNRYDLEEQLRATVSRLVTAAERLGDLPNDCTYTVVLELKDEAPVPVGHPQPWLASSPGLQYRREASGNEQGRRQQKASASSEGRDRGGVRSTAVRSVEAGVFLMEAWVEEGEEKFQWQARETSSKSLSSST